MVTESARFSALKAIPVWPGMSSPLARRASASNATGLRGSSLSAEHAARQWSRAREKTAQTAARATRGAPLARRAGLLQLEFIAVIADHLAGCDRCWSTGRETDRPVDWLSWACLRRPELAEILRPVLTAEGNKRLRTAPPAPVKHSQTAAAGL